MSGREGSSENAGPSGWAACRTASYTTSIFRQQYLKGLHVEGDGPAADDAVLPALGGAAHVPLAVLGEQGRGCSGRGQTTYANSSIIFNSEQQYQAAGQT